MHNTVYSGSGKLLISSGDTASSTEGVPVGLDTEAEDSGFDSFNTQIEVTEVDRKP